MMRMNVHAADRRAVRRVRLGVGGGVLRAARRLVLAVAHLAELGRFVAGKAERAGLARADDHRAVVERARLGAAERDDLARDEVARLRVVVGVVELDLSRLHALGRPSPRGSRAG